MDRSRSSTDTDGLSSARWVLIGAIARPHGVRGDVQIVPFNPESPLWTTGAAMALLPATAARRDDDVVAYASPEMTVLKRIRSGPKGRLIGWFDRIPDREAAEHHKGSWIGVAIDALGELAADEFWYHEVAGWTACTPTDETLGTVVRIIDGPTELLEIRPLSGGETYFVPLVSHFVVAIDRDGQRFVLDLVEGLAP